MLYRVELYQPSSYERAHDSCAFHTFGTLRAALAWAQPQLGTLETTRDNYHRDLARAPYARIVSARGHVFRDRSDTIFRRGLVHGMRVRYVSPPVRLVPSVGELGVTP